MDIRRLVYDTMSRSKGQRSRSEGHVTGYHIKITLYIVNVINSGNTSIL